MSVGDDIFPADRRQADVQTEWAKGWGYGVMGFAEAARMLTEQRAAMGATIDQIGLAVFSLQRHRVELVIKQAMIDLGEPQARVAGMPDKLDVLWREVGAVVRAIDPEDWRTLDGHHGGFVAVMHEADEGSFSYRYPVDKKGQESKRAPFIDLEALERYAAGFEGEVQAYTDWIDEGRAEERYYADQADPGY